MTSKTNSNTSNTLPQGPKTFEPQTWLTTEQVAALLKVGTRTVCNMITAGKLKSSFVGRRFLTSARNVEAFIQAQEQDFTQSE